MMILALDIIDQACARLHWYLAGPRPLKIRTEHVFPPIPIRRYDWSAVDDETYAGPGSPIGRGPTEQAAIADLLEQLEER